jgi:hypothetical protein
MAGSVHVRKDSPISAHVFFYSNLPRQLNTRVDVNNRILSIHDVIKIKMQSGQLPGSYAFTGAVAVTGRV